MSLYIPISSAFRRGDRLTYHEKINRSPVHHRPRLYCIRVFAADTKTTTPTGSGAKAKVVWNIPAKAEDYPALILWADVAGINVVVFDGKIQTTRDRDALLRWLDAHGYEFVWSQKDYMAVEKFYSIVDKTILWEVQKITTQVIRGRKVPDVEMVGMVCLVKKGP